MVKDSKCSRANVLIKAKVAGENRLFKRRGPGVWSLQAIFGSACSFVLSQLAPPLPVWLEVSDNTRWFSAQELGDGLPLVGALDPQGIETLSMYLILSAHVFTSTCSLM